MKFLIINLITGGIAILDSLVIYLLTLVNG